MFVLFVEGFTDLLTFHDPFFNDDGLGTVSLVWNGESNTVTSPYSHFFREKLN